MNNNYEKTCYLLFFLLLVVTFWMLIVTQTRSRYSAEAKCNCAEGVIVNIGEKLAAHTDKIINEIRVNPEVLEETIKNENSNETSAFLNSAKFEVGETVPLPSLPTHVKLCTDYRCYNLWYTPHYRMQQAAYTDENGLRRYGEDYIVGLGRYYSESIGDRFKITLDTGHEFTVIFGDGKAPVDCDENNMYTPCKNYSGEECANVLEFIIDSDAMPNNVYEYGSIDCLEEFSGNIVKMEYLGRDNSADWDTYEAR